MRPSHFLGIDLGGTSIKAAVVDVRTMACVADPVTVPTQVSDGRKAILGQIVLAAERAVSDAHMRLQTLSGVGLASPGPLAPQRGMLLRPVNLKPLWFVPITTILGEALGKPVTLVNDANAAAYGEFRAGGDKDMNDMVLFTLGTGIGGGVIIDGKLLRGHFDNAGELGHMIIVPNGRMCGCGQRGCVEAYAGAKAILREAKKEPSIMKLVPPGGHLTPRIIYQAMQRGNRRAGRILDSACKHLALAIVSVQHAVNPKLVVLGGGLIDMAAAHLVRQVRACVKRLTWSAAADAPTIKAARLGNGAGLLGAAAWACACANLRKSQDGPQERS